MSAAEPAVTECGSGSDTHDYIELKRIEDVQLMLDSQEHDQIIRYIEKLHGIIRKYDNKFAKYKQKLTHFLNKESKTYDEKSTQVADANWPSSQEQDGTEEDKQSVKELSASDAFSFVDEMRQAAKHAENLSNFVYEPTSGLYYDPKTGYYYNAEYGLYYDGNTGCYYSYDQAKDSYEFHSKAQVQSGKCPQSVEHYTNSALTADAEHDNDSDVDVEFDEFGGVITDKATLKQIKADKQKSKERAAKSKRRAKKKHKKKSKAHKERRHKAKRHRKHDSSNDDADENGDRDDKDAGRHSRRKRRRPDVEDGELSHSSNAHSSSHSSSNSSSSSSSSDSESDSDANVPQFKAVGRFQDIAKKYPPSLRIIVQETNVEELTVGSLHLITYKGGTLGREGAHDVIIPDVNVSKCHLKFHYDGKQGIYKCLDVGSRNGTVLNGTRMSETKTASGPLDLVHGSVLQIAQTKLLCHVHEGNSTCGLCEPGLLIDTQVRESAVANVKVLSHKEQLKKLQKKYGLENEKFVESKGDAQHNYNDRAATRRTKVGSSTDKEKTEVACVNTEIASSNKGFKMLSKLGWQKGETLGKSNASAGLLEPIKVVANEGTAGLGSEQHSVGIILDKRKLANLKITQARYQRANDIFVVSDESD